MAEATISFHTCLVLDRTANFKVLSFPSLVARVLESQRDSRVTHVEPWEEAASSSVIQGMNSSCWWCWTPGGLPVVPRAHQSSPSLPPASLFPPAGTLGPEIRHQMSSDPGLLSHILHP